MKMLSFYLTWNIKLTRGFQQSHGGISFRICYIPSVFSIGKFHLKASMLLIFSNQENNLVILILQSNFLELFTSNNTPY